MTRQTVDDSMVLDVFDLPHPRDLAVGAYGTIFRKQGEKTIYVLYWYLGEEDHLRIFFHLPGRPLPEKWGLSDLASQWILLERAPAAIGGERLWFACGWCEKSVRKLYLPPGRTIFGCRMCHSLSYRSRQSRPRSLKRHLKALAAMEATVDIAEMRYQRDVLGLPLAQLHPKGRPSKKELRARAQRAAAAAAEPKRPRGRPKTKRTYTRRQELVLSERTSDIQAYCVKCRDRREMVDPQPVTLKNGRPALQGHCPVCNTLMTRIVKAT
ncbi:MAG: hypothetical protein JW990_11520 [Thermoleophilia bacterium]|nr:hypothetical protein [Thermoleophilia bacterium]